MTNNITYHHNNQERKIKVDFYLCSDLKFLSLCLGINAANSNFACPFCTCCKNDRKLFHILLRITVIMEEGLIKDAINSNNIDKLILIYKDQCGVTYNHYVDKDTNELMFRQLNGDEKKKILENLHDLSIVTVEHNVWIKMYAQNLNMIDVFMLLRIYQFTKRM